MLAVTTGHDPGERAPAEPRKRRLGRPPTLDRDAALRAARDVIAERGFDRTRYADVADASGVPVTTLQHAFGSLQAMLLESVQRSTAAEIAVLRELSHDTTHTPWQRLSEFISGAVLPPDEPDSWLVWLELWRLAGRDTTIGAHAGVVYAQWWDYVAELISLGADAGAFQGPMAERPHDAAVATVGIIDGIAAALVVRADGPDHARTRTLALDAVAAMLQYTGTR
jgi:AcrR family transcriptional regulator